MIGNRTRIQNELYRLATVTTNGAFRKIINTPGAIPAARPVSVDMAGTLTPSEVEVNEINASFGIDESNGRKQVVRKTSWEFELRIGFTVEAYLDEWEEQFKVPPIIARSGTLAQVTLFLTNKSVAHPPRQNPSGGTKVVYLIEATVSRD